MIEQAPPQDSRLGKSVLDTEVQLGEVFWPRHGRHDMERVHASTYCVVPRSL